MATPADSPTPVTGDAALIPPALADEEDGPTPPTPDAKAGPAAPAPEEVGPPKGFRARKAAVLERAVTARRTAERQAEALRQQHASVRLAFDTYDHDRRNAGALLAGGLAYRLFLWLLPLSLVAATLLGVVGDVTSVPPEEIADRSGLPAALTAVVAHAAGDAGGGLIPLLLLGIWATAWAGKSVVKALRLLTAVSWQIRPGPTPHGIRASFAFTGLGVALMLSPVLLRPLYGGPFLADLVVWLLSALAAIPLFAWLLGRLPHPEGVGWTDLLPGAVLLSVGLQALRIATAVYFVGRLERVDDLYGALGIAVVLMVWLFILGRLIVAAMALNAARHRAAQAVNGG
jgi:uncharacterized BrkB/YihY/UPF0761 family membrane protein